MNDILRSENIVRFMAERGSEAAPSTGVEFDAFVASEIRKWGRVVRMSVAKPE